MFQRKLITTVLATTLAITGSAIADGIKSYNFKPLDESANTADWDPAAPWKLPKGFINPATKYVVFSRNVPACSKASKRRCSIPTASFDNTVCRQAHFGLSFKKSYC